MSILRLFESRDQNECNICYKFVHEGNKYTSKTFKPAACVSNGGVDSCEVLFASQQLSILMTWKM